jgi:hypothetical protein
MTAAERSARRYKPLRKSINKRRRAQYKLKVESEASKAARAKSIERRARSRAAVELALADGFDLRTGNIDIADSSVPLILTTAPDDDLACEWLAQWAAAKLTPGGSLICFTDTARIGRDLAVLGRHLRYWWLISQPQPYNARPIEDKRIMSYNNFALWHVKNTRRGKLFLADALRQDHEIFSEAKNDRMHTYGVGPLIGVLTDPGDVIVDPFAVTALAVTRGRQAAAMGRKWIGSDTKSS